MFYTFKILVFETPNSPRSFKFDCTKSREHSSEISCYVTRTWLQTKMNCQKKFNDEEMAARVLMTMLKHAPFLRLFYDQILRIYNQTLQWCCLINHFQAFERVKGFERLQRDYMQCSKLNDKRLDGIEKRMLKLKRIIINSVCQAHAMSTSNLYSESAISIEGNRFIMWKGCITLKKCNKNA